MRLPPEHDRRRKLTDEQRHDIKLNLENLSTRELAFKYGVSRRTVQFILRPEALAENRARREERGGWAQYYDKEKHRIAVRNTRKHRREVFNGLQTGKN